MDSIFLREYKTAVINILKDLYSNTDYWGVSDDGNYGIVKPIGDKDHPLWSNYNFICTNNITRTNVILPYIKNINSELVDGLNYNESYTQNPINREFFRTLWKERYNIFGVNSVLVPKINNIITNSRKKGETVEVLTKLALESIPNTVVVKSSKHGGTKDFLGIDLEINSSVLPKKNSTAQVKGFMNLKKLKNNFYITSVLDRTYTTDLLIFTKKEGDETHVSVFINDPKRIIIESERVIIPVDLVKILINYNYVDKKSNYKIY